MKLFRHCKLNSNCTLKVNNTTVLKSVVHKYFNSASTSSQKKDDNGENSDNDLINVHNVEEDAAMEEDVDELVIKQVNIPVARKSSEKKKQSIVKAVSVPAAHLILNFSQLHYFLTF